MLKEQKIRWRAVKILHITTRQKQPRVHVEYIRVPLQVQGALPVFQLSWQIPQELLRDLHEVEEAVVADQWLLGLDCHIQHTTQVEHGWLGDLGLLLLKTDFVRHSLNSHGAGTGISYGMKCVVKVGPDHLVDKSPEETVVRLQHQCFVG